MSRFARMHFEITNQCNLRCRHCYNAAYVNSKEKKELTTNEVVSIIQFAKSIGIKTFALSGGEVFKRTDIIPIVMACGETVILITNSYLLNDDIIDELVDIANQGKLIEFRISWDGFIGQTVIRNVDSRPVIQNIQKLLERDFLVTVNTSLIKENVNEILDMYALLSDLPVDRWRIDVPFECGNFVNNKSALSIDLSQNFEMIAGLIERYLHDVTKKESEMELDVLNAFRSRILDDRQLYIFSLEDNPCAYRKTLAIRPDGGVSYCATHNGVFGNIMTDSLEEIQVTTGWQQLLSLRIKDLIKCKECKYVHVCGGGCRARALYTTGDIFREDPSSCIAFTLMEKYLLPMLPPEIQKLYAF